MYMYSEEPYDCIACQAKDNQLQDARYWLRAVLDQLFGLEDFSQEVLFHYVEEFAHLLEIPLPNRDLTVVRKDRTVDITKVLGEWKDVNNQYLKNLAKTGS